MASLDDGLLYQRLMYVPGLSGTWKERANQYSQALWGKPYDGTLQTGLDMLAAIGSRNFPQAPAPAAATGAPPVNTTPELSIAEQYSKAQEDLAARVAAIPQFENVMPFYDAWSGMIPQATLAAESQVNPEAMRQYKDASRQYMSGMTSSGGERFGRGLAGMGTLKASAERSRQGQMQDWVGQYRKGYEDIFYNPSKDAWNQARLSGTAPDQSLKEIPTWETLYDTYSDQYGVGESTSPIYG